MNQADSEREAPKRQRGGQATRQSAKPAGSGKRSSAKSTRVQFHLPERIVERLRVHTALSHRNDSAVVGEILLSWLNRYGKGRELFPEEADLGGAGEFPPPE